MSNVPRKQIAQSIAEMIDAGASSNRIAKKIAAYLMYERRTREIDALLRDVQNIRAKHGTIEATATSAFPLSSEVKRAITKLIQAEFEHADHVIINEDIDQSVLGGDRVEAPGKQLDTTIRTKLNKLKQAAA